jgi:hypothetical protein
MMSRDPLRTRTLKRLLPHLCLHFVFGTLDGEVGHLQDVVHFRDLSQLIEDCVLDDHED